MGIEQRIVAWICCLWKSKDDEEIAGSDERCCNPVYHSPTMGNRDESRNHNAAADTSRECEYVDSHYGSSFVKEEDVANGERAITLAAPAAKPIII